MKLRADQPAVCDGKRSKRIGADRKSAAPDLVLADHIGAVAGLNRVAHPWFSFHDGRDRGVVAGRLCDQPLWLESRAMPPLWRTLLLQAIQADR